MPLCTPKSEYVSAHSRDPDEVTVVQTHHHKAFDLLLELLEAVLLELVLLDQLALPQPEFALLLVEPVSPVSCMFSDS